VQPEVGSTIRNSPAATRPPLVIGCGALASELVELTRRAGLPAMDLTCLPASLHNRPEQIPARVAARIRRARRDGYDRIFVAYADCGTGGLLDPVLAAEGVARLEGAHCYEVYAGRAAFATLHDKEPGTFYLTDYLVQNFERLVVRGLGIDRHPELLPIYFGNYRRLVYLAQVEDAGLTAGAQAAARRLGLAFERRFVGLGELGDAVRRFAASGDRTAPAAPRASAPPLATDPAIGEAHDQSRFLDATPTHMRDRLRSGDSMHVALGGTFRGAESTPVMRVAHGRPNARSARRSRTGGALRAGRAGAARPSAGA
jgi:hypothetical protein